MFSSPYVRPSLLSRGINFTKAINWSGILDGTQKTLGVINQAIPIVYQVKPMLNNAKTMFRIADGLRGTTDNSDNIAKPITNSTSVNTNKPIFYI